MQQRKEIINGDVSMQQRKDGKKLNGRELVRTRSSWGKQRRVARDAIKSKERSSRTKCGHVIITSARYKGRNCRVLNLIISSISVIVM